MIALDTNVLVRVLVEDDAAQTETARRLVDRALRDGAALFVPTIAVCETVWVLESAYGFERRAIADAVTWLLAAEQLTVEERDEAERALDAFARGEGDVADLLLRERARARGAHAVATFDRRLQRSSGFVDPDPETWDGGLSLHERPAPYRRVRAARA